MLHFSFYGFLIAIAILISASISERFRKRFKVHDPRLVTFSVWDGVWWVVIPGVIGARFYHVLDYWQYYSENPAEIFLAWHGGLGIMGGIIGGVLGLWAFLKLKIKNEKVKTTIKNSKFYELFLFLLDIIVIGLPVGQAIGRLGNFFNQELYGLPTNLPWGIYINPENRLLKYESFERFHPLFLYEAGWSIIIFIIIITIIRIIKKRKKGVLFFTYLGLYGFGRFFLEFLRPESWTIVFPVINWHLRIAQGVSIIFILISLKFLYDCRVRKVVRVPFSGGCEGGSRCKSTGND